MLSVSHSVARLFATPWIAAHQGPVSMRFSRQRYWSGLPFPSPEDLPNPGIEPGSPALQADSLLIELQGKPLVAIILTVDEENEAHREIYLRLYTDTRMRI